MPTLEFIAQIKSLQEENESLIAEIKRLRELSSDLLQGVDTVSGPPFYIVQPFLGIIKNHAETIRSLQGYDDHTEVEDAQG